MADGGGYSITGALIGPYDGQPDRKRPLFRDPPPAPDFPLHALGALRHAAEAVHQTTQAPMAVCAQSVLAAATLAVQPHWDVQLPGGAGRRPLTAFFVSVLESGERKSTVDRLALAPAHKIEAGFRERYGEEKQAYANAKEAWDAARAHAKKFAKGDKAALMNAFARMGPEPRLPAQPMLLVADPTPEALVMQLTARPWGGLFTAEGGLFVGGSAMNDETKTRTGALLNILWDGDPIRRVRIGTGLSFLPGRRCSAHIMMQPSIASGLLADPMLAGIGTLARVLLVAPPGTAGTRAYRDPPREAKEVLAAYGAQLDSIMLRDPRTAADDPTVLDPVPLELDDDARAIWIAFHDAAELGQASGGPLHPIRAFASKMAEHAGRLAAVLTVYANSAATHVAAEAMAGGVELANHYAAEMLRLQGASAIAVDLQHAAALLVWWKERPDPQCHLAEVYQRGPNMLRDAKTARRVVGELVEHGYVTSLPPGTELDGAPRREAWELVP